MVSKPCCPGSGHGLRKLLALAATGSDVRLCLRLALQRRPDVVILIDYPGFNLRFVKALRERTDAILLDSIRQIDEAIPVPFGAQGVDGPEQPVHVGGFDQVVEGLPHLAPFMRA